MGLAPNKKRIGIDMRMAAEGFGIGRYTTELVEALLRRTQSPFEYALFFEPSFSRPMYERFSQFHPRCRLLPARYYSFKEQVILPVLLRREKLDLLHVPNFNAPVAYPGKIIITIHDLIHHHMPGSKKRNLLWRLGYRAAIRLASWRAERIIAVSQATKRDICGILHVPKEKIQVIYEGVSQAFSLAPTLVEKLSIKRKYNIPGPYILAVGVGRRYKNLPFLAAAVRRLRKHKKLPHQLVLVGDDDPHYPEVRQLVIKEFTGDNQGLVMTGRVPFEDLVLLYQGAACFAAPSLFEGFGLPSLEAQAAGAPVVSADIPVAREVLDDSAIFFDPHNLTAGAEALYAVLTENALATRLAERGRENARKFTWERTAEQTEAVYRRVLGM